MILLNDVRVGLAQLYCFVVVVVVLLQKPSWWAAFAYRCDERGIASHITGTVHGLLRPASTRCVLYSKTNGFCTKNRGFYTRDDGFPLKNGLIFGSSQDLAATVACQSRINAGGCRCGFRLILTVLRLFYDWFTTVLRRILVHFWWTVAPAGESYGRGAVPGGAGTDFCNDTGAIFYRVSIDFHCLHDCFATGVGSILTRTGEWWTGHSIHNTDDALRGRELPER